VASDRSRGQAGPGDISGHRDLGEAVLRLIDEASILSPEPRSTKRQLTYILSKRTGASRESVTRQLGVSVDSLRRWLKGKQKPSAKNTKRIAEVYERFWRINHDARNPRKRPKFKTEALLIENVTNRDGIIFPEGRRVRVVNPLRIDASRQRKWTDVLRATTPEEAFKAFVKGVIGVGPLPSIPEYLDFLQGHYTIRVA
jgi:transcriptional regulator with XRE-family HTH domain